MTTAFDEAFAHVVGKEGRFCDNPNDSGGATCWGITERTARSNSYFGNMADMPIEVAKEIYRRRYWGRLGCDFIAAVAPRLAEELFDSGVNCGIDRAAVWLQRALNGLNRGGKLYADIPVDGAIGKVTLTAFDALYSVRGGDTEIALRRLCDAQQGAYYLDLALTREKDETFLYGWVMNRLGGA